MRGERAFRRGRYICEVDGEMERRTFVDLSEKRPQQPAREILICSQIMFADRQSLRSVKPRGRSMTPLDATT